MPYFDRLDIVEAHYLFYIHWHSGQWSEMYARLCKMDKYFKPGPYFGLQSLSENGRAIYDELVKKHGRQAVNEMLKNAV